jgi:hypothetical protein
MHKILAIALAAGMAFASIADAKPLRKGSKRSDYTAAEQAAFYKAALAACRKEFGTRVHSVKVNYARATYTCVYYW